MGFGDSTARRSVLASGTMDDVLGKSLVHRMAERARYLSTFRPQAMAPIAGGYADDDLEKEIERRRSVQALDCDWPQASRILDRLGVTSGRSLTEVGELAGSTLALRSPNYLCSDEYALSAAHSPTRSLLEGYVTAPAAWELNARRGWENPLATPLAPWLVAAPIGRTKAGSFLASDIGTRLEDPSSWVSSALNVNADPFPYLVSNTRPPSLLEGCVTAPAAWELSARCDRENSLTAPVSPSFLTAPIGDTETHSFLKSGIGEMFDKPSSWVSRGLHLNADPFPHLVSNAIHSTTRSALLDMPDGSFAYGLRVESPSPIALSGTLLPSIGRNLSIDGLSKATADLLSYSPSISIAAGMLDPIQELGIRISDALTHTSLGDYETRCPAYSGLITDARPDFAAGAPHQKREIEIVLVCADCGNPQTIAEYVGDLNCDATVFVAARPDCDCSTRALAIEVVLAAANPVARSETKPRFPVLQGGGSGDGRPAAKGVLCIVPPKCRRT